MSLLADVTRIANAATAHNYGGTVWDASEWREGEVWLTLSSWPRAQEAAAALSAAGFVVNARDDGPCDLMVSRRSA